MDVLIVLLVIALIALGLVFFLKARRRRFSSRDRAFVSMQWRIIQDLKKTNPAQAVADADKLCDWALKKCGYTGSFADKLRASESLFSDADSLWGAHKMRNRLAHELNVQISRADADAALAAFRRALRDVGL